MHAKTDPLILARLDQCISTAKAKHSEADILAAAKALGIADMLPDVTSFDLFKSVTK